MTTLYATVDGAEDAPWLILSNSLGASAEMWVPQLPELTRRYRVLRYDTRGHGRSDAPPGPYSFDDLTGDVLGLMDAHGIQTAAFMGLSMGGMTGMGLGLAHPERFTKLIVADARADAPTPFQEMWDQRIAAVQSGGLAAIVDGTLESWLTAPFRQANPEATADIRAMVLANDPAGYIACCRALKTLDYLKDLGQLKVPTLFVGGAHDKGAPPEVMAGMVDATPGARYAQIPDAAHVANINNAPAFTAAVADFLQIP